MAFPMRFIVILTNMIFLILEYKICVHLEYLLDSVNQYFPKDQWITLQDHALVKDSFKAQNKSTDFYFILLFKILNFLFWNNFRLREELQSGSENSQLAFTQLAWMVTSGYRGPLIKTKKLTWPVSCHITKYSKFIDIFSGSTSQLTFKNYHLFEFHLIIKENFQKLSEKQSIFLFSSLF